MAKAKTEVEAKPKAKSKVYRFNSDNAYLFVRECNAQFIDGVYETADEEVAKYLMGFSQIRLVK